MKLVIILCMLAGICAGCGSNAAAHPQAADILGSNPEADIFQWENIIYANAENAGWLEEQDYQKKEKLGEIQRTSSNPDYFNDGTASALPEGTPVYGSSDNENQRLTVETEKGTTVYIGLFEE